MSYKIAKEINDTLLAGVEYKGHSVMLFHAAMYNGYIAVTNNPKADSWRRFIYLAVSAPKPQWKTEFNDKFWPEPMPLVERILEICDKPSPELAAYDAIDQEE